MRLQAMEHDRPVWTGGGDYHTGVFSKLRTLADWRWRRVLEWGSPAMPRMRLVLNAHALKDYGRGRRSYSWALFAEFGVQRLELKSGKATSQRQIHQEADAYVELLGEEQVRAMLWAQAWQAGNCKSVFKDGLPFASVCAAVQNEYTSLPAGDGYFTFTPHGGGGVWMKLNVFGRHGGYSGTFSRELVLPEVNPWTGALAS
jgi:hypothetical protein